ncbi:MAG: 7-carboxy-7-deazaguanine synthase QueE [Bacteroidetes bacterium]|nr:7-carboxy-7-deazaguanine synthase QueE [Bacteroidota bacterium]
MEHFYTIQGEGYYQGRAAYFVRLGGCDVGCPWCDVKESWDADAHPQMSVQQIVDAVEEAGAKICVITGGEPLMYDLTALTSALRDKGIRSHIETSGAYPARGTFDWITVSPKRYKPPVESILPLASELKIVINHRNDFRWAEQYAAKVSASCKLFLSPEWEQEEEMVPMVIEYVKEHQQWEISLQIHKYLNVP